MIEKATKLQQKVQAYIDAIEKFPHAKKVLEQQPTWKFGEEYNFLVEACKAIAQEESTELWPPTVVKIGAQGVSGTYIEFLAYLKALLAILQRITEDYGQLPMGIG